MGELHAHVSMPTLNREMAALVTENYLLIIGGGRAENTKITAHY